MGGIWQIENILVATRFQQHSPVIQRSHSCILVCSLQMCFRYIYTYLGLSIMCD